VTSEFIRLTCVVPKLFRYGSWSGLSAMMVHVKVTAGHPPV